MLGFATLPVLDRLLERAGRAELFALDSFAVAPTLACLSASTVGAVLASRRPAHPVGWLLLATGLCLAVGGVSAGYIPYGLVVRPGEVPGVAAVALYSRRPPSRC
jgi:hypothetical protein